MEGIHLDREKFCCPICRDLLDDPVATPCGHSYCYCCITSHLDNEDHKQIYSCPECKQDFRPRPALVKNSMVAFVVQELRRNLKRPPPTLPLFIPPRDDDDECYAGHDDVPCDVCRGLKLKAVKSCLQCGASYCRKHLQPHYDAAPLKKHKLVEPSADIYENICPRHQEVMKIFCCTDQRCICYLCSKDEHKGHVKVSAAAERTRRQTELEASRRKIQQRIRDREKEMTVLQQEEEAVNESANSTLINTKKIFSDVIRVTEAHVTELDVKIRSLQKIEVGRYRKVRERMEQEITELRKKDAELENLTQTEDHTRFLLNYSSALSLSESKDPPALRMRRRQYFEKVSVALAEARDRLHEVLGEEYAKIALTMGEADVSASNPNGEPRTRGDFLKYACQITLDPNTANPHLLVSKENRKVTFVREELGYSYNPERFTYSWQVLSKEALTGRCYWEVERSGRGVLVAVTYGDIIRNGNFHESVFGYNDKSWALDCYKNSYEFRHNGAKIHIPGTWSSRIGVYVDHKAGILSFFSVSDKMVLLHKVKAALARPVHAGLWLSDGAVVEVVELRATDDTGSR